MRGSMLAAVAVVLVVGGVGCQLWPSPSPDDDDDESTPGEDESSRVVSFDEPLEVAEGDAFRGPWRMNESDFHYVDDPGVAFDDDGRLHVVWVDNERQDAFFQRFDDQHEPMLEEAANVSSSPEIFSWLPRVAPSRVDEDTIYVLWQEIEFTGGSHGGEIYFARSTDGGETFGEPINLSETTAGAGKGRLNRDRWNNGSLDLVVGPEDELYVVWTEYEGPLRFARSHDGGESFEEPQHIAGGDEQPARAPTLALAPDGRLYLAWAVGEDPQADIWLAKSVDGGESFRQLDTPIESPAHSDAPGLAVDHEETVHLVFSDSPDGPFQRYRVLHSYSTDRAASFEAPTEVSELQGDVDSANFPSVAVDEQGHVFVTWQHYPDFRQRPFGMGFAASDDGGESFEPPTGVPHTVDPELGINGGLQGMLMGNLAATPEGDVAVGHSHFNENVESGVRVIPGRAD